METITKHRPGVAAVNTFFFTNLQKYGYKKIRPTVRAEDLINKDVIFIPMNINEQHWVLGVWNTIEWEYINKKLQILINNINNKSITWIKASVSHYYLRWLTTARNQFLFSILNNVARPSIAKKNYGKDIGFKDICDTLYHIWWNRKKYFIFRSKIIIRHQQFLQ